MAEPRHEGLDRVARTARWTAAERARETARPDRLFDDPFAATLAGAEGLAMAGQMRHGGVFDTPGFAVRTRFFDDALVTTLRRSDAVTQAVLVAAGMDARAFRLPLPPDLEWYELDRPDLLALKDRSLDELGATPRCARHPVGVDLTAAWAEPLVDAGFEPSRPTVWLVEGLIFYLEPDSVHRLLDEITRMSAAGSELLIDTIGRSILDSASTRSMRDRLDEHGIPWRFGTDQPEADLFAPRGWTATASLASDVGTRLGRWPGPAFPRDTPGVPQSFLVHAAR